MALGPMFFSMIGDKPSGPKALELLDLLIAAWVWVGVNSTSGSFVFFFRERRVRLKGWDDLESLGGGVLFVEVVGHGFGAVGGFVVEADALVLRLDWIIVEAFDGIP